MSGAAPTIPTIIDAPALLERYDGLLLDAYGVLVDAAGALPGARELVVAARARGLRTIVVTNDASRSPSTAAARLTGLGLDFSAEDVVTSGSLIAGHMARAGLTGCRCAVLGTADSRGYVADAGATVVDLSDDTDIDALAVCDDAGYPFLAGAEAALSALYRRLDRGRPVALILPNPDLIYPKSGGRFGFTAGAIALLLEAGLERRYGAAAPRFARLGKPAPLLFEEACRRLGAERQRVVMIGDQIETDIAGAHAAGIDAALLENGVSRWRGDGSEVATPRWLLARLWPDPVRSSSLR